MAAQVLWTHPNHGPISNIGHGSQGFRTANFLDVPKIGLKNNPPSPWRASRPPTCPLWVKSRNAAIEL